MFRALASLVVLMMALPLVGCGASAGKYDLQVQLEDTLKSSGGFPPVEVDIIGVQSPKTVTAVPVDTHFGDPEAVRETKKFKTTTLGGKGPSAVTIKADDKLYTETWMNPKFIVVMARTPFQDKDDARRLVFSLNKERWNQLNGKPITIRIFKDRIIADPEPGAVKEEGPEGF